MNFRIITLLLFLFLPLSIFAQKGFPGYIITTEGDSVKGTIKSGNVFRMQKSLVFYRQGAAEKTVYTPDQVTEYGYIKNKEEVCYQSLHIPYSTTYSPDDRIFLRVLNKGYLKLYQMHESSLNSNNITGGFFGRSFLIKKGEHKYRRLNTSGFIKRISEYLNDYPELASDIKNDKYRKLKEEFIEIVDLYNRWYENKNKIEGEINKQKTDDPK